MSTKKKQINNKTSVVEKPSCSAPLAAIPTAIILTTETLASRLKSQSTKKIKFSWRSKEAYQL